MAPYYLDPATEKFVCNKERDVGFQAPKEYEIRCTPDGFGTFGLYVNDPSFPLDEDVPLPFPCANGESDDIKGRKILYQFRIPCNIPSCVIVEPTMSPAPTATKTPTLSPSVSSIPTTLAPSETPTDNPTVEPTILTTESPTVLQTESPTASVPPTPCIDQTRPQLESTLGTQVPLPNGAVTIVNQGGTTARLEITQLWSNNTLGWISPYYATEPGKFECPKNREIEPDEVLAYDVPCFEGFIQFNVIVNDLEFPAGSDLGLPEGCTSDIFDVPGKKVAYIFRVQCTDPNCSDGEPDNLMG